ncbi:MAG: hypothetical protein C0507_00190 [Cyanobacteria bacterium PR.3.49]|nr:hypothetical protein [Cyanobacteria bacterium PR.3.49]
MYIYESILGKPLSGSASALKNYFENHVAGRPLVIHIHGGLNDGSDAQGLAFELTPKYESAGGHPLFFVWHSDILHSLAAKLESTVRKVVNNGDFRKLETSVRASIEKPKNKKKLKKARAERKSLAKSERARNYDIPIAVQTKQKYRPDEKEVEEAIDKKFSPLDFVPKINSKHARYVNKNAGRNFGQERLNWFTDAVSFLVDDTIEVIARIMWRKAHDDDRGIPLLIYEEVLRCLKIDRAIRPVWDGMKSSIERSFKKGGAGTAFIKSLNNYLKKNPDTRIVLIGHSAGTIYVSHLIDAAAKKLPSNIKFEVVFQASACTFKDFDRLVYPHRKRIKGIRFFGLGQKREKDDVVFHGLYPRSLLYFVSGVIEKHADESLIGMATYFREGAYYKKEVKRIREYMQPPKLTRVWAPRLGIPGGSSNATRHEDFSKEHSSLESVQDIIRLGIENTGTKA